MIKHIKAAELKYYNANNRGKNVGDCVKRSMSLAFDISYSEMAKILNEKMHKMHRSKWNIPAVFKAVVADLGGGEYIIPEEDMTLEEFTDNFANPNDIYLCLTGKQKGITSHAVTVRNGKIWDSWNSKNQHVTGYWHIDGSNSKEIRDTDKNYMADMANNYADPVISKEIERYMFKKGWVWSKYEVESSVTTSYRIKVYCTIVLEADDVMPKDREYHFDIALVIEPTWTEEEIIDFINKQGKQKAYDRMWAISKQEEKLAEAYAVAKESGVEDGTRNGLYDDWGFTKQEKKFISTLPGWVLPLIKYVSIEQPGQYHDSYQLRIKLLPGDDSHPDEHYARFEDYDANGIRTQLDRYKKNYELPGIDYYKDW